MKKTILIIGIIIGILVIFGLFQILFFRSTGNTIFGNQLRASGAQSGMGAVQMMAEPDAAGAVRAGDLLAGSNQPGLEYIRAFSLHLTTDDPKTIFRNVRNIAASYNGIVTSSMISNNMGEMNLFVPQEKANAVIDAIIKLNVQVKSQMASIQEVSMAHQDIQARIITLNAIKEQYDSILKDAKTVRDILLLTGKIAETDKSIQELTLSNTEMTKEVNYATIKVIIYNDAIISPDECWSPTDVFYQAMKSLMVVMQKIISIFIWLIIYVLPLGLIVALIALGIRKAYRKFKKVTT